LLAAGVGVTDEQAHGVVIQRLLRSDRCVGTSVLIVTALLILPSRDGYDPVNHGNGLISWVQQPASARAKVVAGWRDGSPVIRPH
jgi:hypothetical protein